jgi:hypothetical protein
MVQNSSSNISNGGNLMGGGPGPGVISLNPQTQMQGMTVGGGSGGPAGFNQTKKNLPQLKKITDHKKSYVSPYSFKGI